MSTSVALSAQCSGSDVFSLLKTDPNEKITVSEYRAYTDTYPKAIETNYRDFFDSVAKPDNQLHQKEGPCFLIGRCDGYRQGINVKDACVAVLDADSSLLPSGEAVEGAPPPLQVHEALKAWGISHHIYTTFSHGKKGNRYRVVFPVRLADEAQLRAFVLYIVSSLQEHAGIPICLTRESHIWGQGWAKPRVEDRGAPFYSETFWGSVPEPSYLVKVYPVSTQGGAAQIMQIPPAKESANSGLGLMKLFADYNPLPQLLSDHGYTFVSQSIMLDPEGLESPVLRFRKPDSDSAPGVVVFHSQDRWRCYSHHQNDPLATGYAVDAFDAYCLLNNINPKTDGLKIAVESVHAGLAQEMNLSHPSVLAGGNKFRMVNRVLSESYSESVAYMSFADFKLSKNSDPPIPVLTSEDDRVGIKYLPRADWWLQCRDRIMFHGDTFVPTPLGTPYDPVIVRGEKPYYNLFRGWTIDPVQGDWDLINWHIFNVLCSRDQEQYEYLLDWLAHLIQHPNEKPQVAVVMRGGKGVGKSLFMSKIARALGTAGMVFSGNNLLTGRFNNHLRNKLMLVLEESFWAGNKQEEGRLKHIISDVETTFEGKGIDAQQGVSVVRICMITNNDWSVPVSSDERRYFIPTISDAGKERDVLEGGYFSRLAKSLDGGGLSAMFHDLMARPVSLDRLRKIPHTAEFRRQQALSLDGLDAWIFDALMSGSFSSDRVAVVLTEMRNVISGADLAESAKAYMGPFSAQRSMHVKLQQYLKDTFGALASPVASSTLGSYSLELGPLSSLRQKYEQKLGYKVEWSGSTLPPEAAE
jgi:hypothetical protein